MNYQNIPLEHVLFDCVCVGVCVCHSNSFIKAAFINLLLLMINIIIIIQNIFSLRMYVKM